MKKTGKISRSAYKSPIFPGGFIFLNLTLSKRVSWIIRETWRIFRPLPVTRFSQRSKRNAHTAAYTFPLPFPLPPLLLFPRGGNRGSKKSVWRVCISRNGRRGLKDARLTGEVSWLIRLEEEGRLSGGIFENGRWWERERERVDNGEKSWISKANIFQCLEGEEKSNAFKRRQSLNIQFHTRISTFAKVYLEKLLYSKSFPINCLFHNRIYDGFPWKQDFTYNSNVPLSKIVRILRFHFSISEKYNPCDPYWLKYFEKGILKKLD